MKIKSQLIFFLSSLGVFLCLAITSFGQSKIFLSYTAKELSEKMIHNENFSKYGKGENFCWQAAYGMDEYVGNFQLTKNMEWLDAGISYYDFLIGKMDTDPDGYKGWMCQYRYG